MSTTAPYSVRRDINEGGYRIMIRDTMRAAVDESGEPLDGGGYKAKEDAIREMLRLTALQAGKDFEWEDRPGWMMTSTMTRRMAHDLRFRWTPAPLGICPYCDREATRRWCPENDEPANVCKACFEVLLNEEVWRRQLDRRREKAEAKRNRKQKQKRGVKQ